MSFILLGILNGQAGAAPAVPVAAYQVAGIQNQGGNIRNVYKLTYATETFSSLALVDYGSDGMGFANSGVAGYSVRGRNFNTIYSTTYKFAFPTDTKTNTTSMLARFWGQGFANTGTAGYQAGGYTNTTGAMSNQIRRMTFATDASATLAATLTTSKMGNSAFADKNNAGYYAGGGSEYTSTYISTVDKLSFPAESKSTLATGLSGNRGQSYGFEDNAVAGYAGSGVGPSYSNNIDKFAFPSESRTTLASGLSSSTINCFSGSASGVAGYAIGGNNPSTNVERTTVDKFSYPTDTRTTLATGMPVATTRGGQFSDQGNL